MYVKSRKTKFAENILTKENLYNWYIVEGKTIKEICEITGIKSDITIRKHMDIHNIARRSINKERQLKTMQGMNTDEFKSYLIDMYINKKLSINKISYELKVSSRIVKKYLNLFNIQTLDRYEANTFFNSAKGNHKWIGGRRIKPEGYVLIYAPEHPCAGKSKSVYEHRLVMEKHIGRYLNTNEIVHHKNGNKSDNRIENLELVNNSSHIKKHDNFKNKIYYKCTNEETWVISGHGKCILCNETSRRHKGLGYCSRCYQVYLKDKKGVVTEC